MVAALFDITPLLPALTQGELILTANNRLRNHILRAYAAYQIAQGSTAWPTPSIYPLNQWLRQCWDKLQNSAYQPSQALIATGFQRQYLWEVIINESPESDALLQPEPLAQSADSALRNLSLWQLSSADLDGYDNENSRCFCQWLRSFNASLAEQQLITEETAQTIIAQAFADGALPRVTRIYLQGFDDIPPLYQHLLSLATDTIIELPAHRQMNNQVWRVTTADTTNEIRHAALWAKAQLETGQDPVIGIIVPNLGQCRDAVERIFTEVFEPLAGMPHVPRHTLPFNFSAGIPLATTPIVFSALELLNLNLNHWDLDALCDLLHSPFFGDVEAELVLRTLVCEKLNNLGKLKVSITDLRHYAQRLSEQLPLAHTDHLAARLVALESTRRGNQGEHSAGYWVDYFQDQLNTLGWPGVRRLDSQEYQQVTLWYQVLETFAALDSSNIRLGLNQALKQLRNLAGKTPFQAQTPDSPIQILGALEGAGLQFSHCWIMGLHHRQWPPAPNPNPFLPLPLQRQYKMPHASAERELVFAQALTDNYRHCAAQVVLSSAHNDSEYELQPSTLIRDVPLTDIQELVPNPLSEHQQNLNIIAASKQWQLIEVASGPALIVNELPARGGSNLFKLQGACPFNAFARLRLGAHQPTLTVAGFSPIDRGTLLHDALAMIWSELKNSHTLQMLSETAELELLERVTAKALAPLQQKRAGELGAFYCSLEQERLINLLSRWLAEEKQRPAFRVIAIEQDRIIHFAGLTLKLRMDRIDQLETGELLLIDYKTGEPKIKSWFGERPDEPQLPLYAVTEQDPVSAIAFAQLNAKTVQWLGAGQLNIYHPGIANPPIEWAQQLAEWQHTLQQLAYAFIAGDARVDFKDINAQRYAEDLLPLNRYTEVETIKALIAEQKITLVGGQQ